MSSTRYERVAAHDADDHDSPTSPHGSSYADGHIPSSPPPSFRSRASSPTSRSHLLSEHDPLTSDADRTLADTFDSPSDDEDDDDERRRNGQDGEGERSNSDEVRPRHRMQRSNTVLPQFIPTPSAPGARRVYGGGNNDGVFANLSAKPTRGEEVDEKPPTYEQAAADATPPYWETTILAPGSMYSPDSVFVDGLPVGSLFSFVWNAMISMSFQLVGFLLTYLLHTTHAAKNGSRAGLGITLVQYGFSMKGASSGSGSGPSGAGSDNFDGSPPDPTSHDFDPAAVAPTDAPGAVDGGGLTTSDWLAYILMIVGWFILIRAVSDFLRARRHEQLVLQSPDRGLGVPVVAEGEQPETSV